MFRNSRILVKYLATPQMAISLYVVFLVICYLPGLPESGFLVDDDWLIHMPILQSDFSLKFLKAIFTPGINVDYYPLRDLSYWVDLHIFGGNLENAIVFRVHNFLWFILAGFFVYQIAKARLRDWTLAILIAGVFLLNPQANEFYMWPSARKDVMSLALALGSFFYFMKWNNNFPKRYGVFSVFLFVMASLAMASYLAVPILLFFSSAFNKKPNWKFLPFGVIALILAGANKYVYSEVNNMKLDHSFYSMLIGPFAGLGRSFVGWFYSSVNAVDLDNWGLWYFYNWPYAIIGLVAVCMFALVLFKVANKNKQIDFIPATVIGLLIMTPGFNPSHRAFYSTRYYFLTIGLIVLMFVFQNFQKHIKKVLLIFILAFSTQTVIDAKNWESSKAQFSKAVSISPENPALKYYLLASNYEKFNWGRMTPVEIQESDLLAEDLAKQCDPELVLVRRDHLCWGTWSFVVSNSNLVKSHLIYAAFKNYPIEKIGDRLSEIRNLKNNLIVEVYSDPQVFMSKYHNDEEYRGFLLHRCKIYGPTDSQVLLSELIHDFKISQKQIVGWISEAGMIDREQLKICLRK